MFFEKSLQIHIPAPFAAGPAADSEDVGGAGVGVKGDEVPRAGPGEAFAGQEVFHLVGFAVADA